MFSVEFPTWLHNFFKLPYCFLIFSLFCLIWYFWDEHPIYLKLNLVSFIKDRKSSKEQEKKNAAERQDNNQRRGSLTTLDTVHKGTSSKHIYF